MGICDDLNKPQTSIVIVFYLVYDIGSIFSTPDSKEQVKLKPQGTNDNYIYIYNTYLSLGYLFKLKSPDNSISMYVRSNWNHAYDKWDNFE